MGEWETVPFHFIWVSLTLLYGVRIWRPQPTPVVLAAVSLYRDADPDRRHDDTQDWSELTEVPLMTAMFVAMVWHARRRQDALGQSSGSRRSAHRCSSGRSDSSHEPPHELRTPVTIARGHLEVLESANARQRRRSRWRSTSWRGWSG